MIDSTRTEKDDLRFLLKDKYNLTELQIEEIVLNPDSAPKEIRDDINLLKTGYPVDYIIGYCDFLGLKIDLEKRPLIPRPETEFWTNKIVNTINKESKLELLDIFCGSGCVGLALLKNFPNATCTFADINAEFLSQTKHNADINGISQERFQLIESDVFSRVAGKFDLITANPPYVSKYDQTQPSVKYEPAHAIFAEDNGLDLIRKFLTSARDYLNDGGKIFMEFGESQKQELEEILKRLGYTQVHFNADQFGKWRWIEAS